MIGLHTSLNRETGQVTVTISGCLPLIFDSPDTLIRFADNLRQQALGQRKAYKERK